MACARLLLLAISLAVVTALPDISNLFEYNEGDRYVAMSDSEGKLRLVDLTLTDLNSRFDVEKDVLFLLYTRANPTTPQFLKLEDDAALANSNFNPNNPTLLIVHGWTGNPQQDLYLLMREKILSVRETNIISVDWSVGASALYPTSVNYVPPIGDRVAKFVDWLVSRGSALNGFHVVGHSLGGQLVGFIGRSVTSGTFPYITSLDPAMPLWGVTSDRIRPSDARYVEVIHTNGRNLGLYTPVGHGDFYPNGGKQMPGCSIIDMNCSHGLSADYFSYSLGNERFAAQQCASAEEIEEGQCSNLGTAYMGGLVPKTIRGVYSLTTTADPPYYVDA